MRPEHLDQILAIEEEAFASPWPAEAFLQDLDPAETPWARSYVLVEAGGRPAGGAGEVRGYVCFWLLHGEMDIHNIAVRARDRRRGGARFMLREAFAEAARRGCRSAFLEVRPSNEAAIALYRKFGFSPVARRRAYYEDNGEDALVMRAEVPASGAPAPAAFLKGRKTW
jgi:ribosomal-protein-alanine N-acetyltransferase